MQFLPEPYAHVVRLPQWARNFFARVFRKKFYTRARPWCFMRGGAWNFFLGRTSWDVFRCQRASCDHAGAIVGRGVDVRCERRRGAVVACASGRGVFAPAEPDGRRRRSRARRGERAACHAGVCRRHARADRAGHRDRGDAAEARADYERLVAQRHSEIGAKRARFEAALARMTANTAYVQALAEASGGAPR